MIIELDPFITAKRRERIRAPRALAKRDAGGDVAERWLSGLKRLTANEVALNRAREFESRPLRIFLKNMLSAIKKLKQKKFYRGFIPLDPKKFNFPAGDKMVFPRQSKKLHLSGKDLTGLTLIELLVVIAIIALIAVAILIAISNVRIKGRDAKRLAEIKQIEKAIQFYYEDHGYYPGANDEPLISTDWWDPNYGWWYLSRVLEPYLKKIPVDPINKQINNPWPSPNYDHSGDYFYYYYSPQRLGALTGSNVAGEYDLWVRLENKKNPYRCEFVGYLKYEGFSNLSICGDSDAPEMKDVYSPH